MQQAGIQAPLHTPHRSTCRARTADESSRPPLQLGVGGRWSVAVGVVVPLLTFAVTYPVSRYTKQMSDPRIDHLWLTFLSSTINYAPASCIGAFFLSLAIIALIFVVLTRHLQMGEEIVDARSAITTHPTTDTHTHPLAHPRAGACPDSF